MANVSLRNGGNGNGSSSAGLDIKT